MSDTPSVRLNKYLAEKLQLSRRAADELIEQGRVELNSTPAILGTRINPSSDTLLVDGKAVDTKTPTVFAYVLFNKPVGYVCSRRQQGEAATIYELLPKEYSHLKPVGRLDKDSSGLLLLTNDGDFAHSMTHPSFHKTKTYEIELDKPLQPLHHQMICDYGIQLDDGPSKLQLERQLDDDDVNWIVLMHEGRNRQIRRTFAALGYAVISLHRTVFGSYAIEGLAQGACKEALKK